MPVSKGFLFARHQNSDETFVASHSCTKYQF